MRPANGIMALEFDERNGSLVQIEDLKTGLKHLKNPADGRLFRLLVPDEELWIDRHCDSHESGCPEFASKPGAPDTSFRSLHAGAGAEAAIAATVHVVLPEGGDEALLTLSIENHDSNVVCTHRCQSGDACGIVLGEVSPDAHRGGGRVRLDLDDSVMRGLTRRHAILHRQDGSSHAIPLERSDSGAALDLLLDRWECAVVQLRMACLQRHWSRTPEPD